MLIDGMPLLETTLHAGIETVVLIGITVALSAASYALRGKPENNIAKDDRPTALATRGAYAPVLIGRRRLGYLVCWVGDRTFSHDTVGGKGSLSGGQRIRIWYEGAMHVLCVGPASRLWRITWGEKAIWTGPIDPTSHPSGTVVDTGAYGQFAIYWGEGDQPVNTRLGDASRIGIDSQWPYVCYIDWISKRLGEQPIWQFMDYELEVRPFATGLVDSPAWIEPTRDLSGRTFNVFEGTDGVRGTANFVVTGNAKQAFKPGTWFALTGNAAESRDYRVAYAQVFLDISVIRTRVYLDDVLTGSNDAGSMELYTTNEDDGVNPAHALWQLLFEKFPHGAAQPQEDYDLDSLEALGRLLAEEVLPGSVLASVGDPEQADGVIASILQDLGVVPSFDWDTGKVRFMPMRAVADENDTPLITADLLAAGSVPEQEIVQGSRPTDRAIFKFRDRTRNFQTMTLPYDDDGQSGINGRPTPREVFISLANDFATATKMQARRIPEDFGSTIKYKLRVQRAGSLLTPGQQFRCFDIDEMLRVWSVTPEALTGVTQIETLVDHLGTDPSMAEGSDGGGKEQEQDEILEDLAQTIVEVPASQVVGRQQVLIVPRIRATETISRADLHISRDDVTYTLVGSELNVQTGGTLTTAMLASDAYVEDQGPTISALGPDIADVLDLSADVTSWRAGRQLVAIDDELFHLKKVTALGGGLYRLDGLVRARYDTVRAAHSIGANVFIFIIDEVEDISDILIVPDVLLYVKAQPFTTEALPLSEVTAISRTLRGKGITPMDVVNVRTVNNSNSFSSAGEDIVLKWAYRSAIVPGTGAGAQGYGMPTGDSPVDGSFLVRLKNSGGSVLREVVTTSPTYTYTSVNRTADGIAGVTFKVDVANVSGGYSSTPVEITVTKV